MEKSLRELADHLGGTVIGDENVQISGIASLDDAREGQITFLANPKYAAKVATTRPLRLSSRRGERGMAGTSSR